MGKLALVFPGQGSQAVGMGEELAKKYRSAAAVYSEASEVLGWDIAGLCFLGPADKLNRTEFAQPALYVNSMAAMAVLKEHGISGDVVSGHSLGEYSALGASGALDFAEGLELVARRGEAMARAAAQRPGTMAAILGLEDALVEEICKRAGEAWAVNYNCPGQLVISGETAAVRRAMAEAGQAGAKKVVELPVSGSFHSPLTQPAAVEMREQLARARFKDPQPPFFSSISCRYEKASGLKDLLERQMISPVRWRQAVENLIDDGAEMFFEAGNGKVLCGLIRRINRDVIAVNISDPATLDKALALTT